MLDNEDSWNVSALPLYIFLFAEVLEQDEGDSEFNDALVSRGVRGAMS